MQVTAFSFVYGQRIFMLMALGNYAFHYSFALACDALKVTRARRTP